MGKLTPKQKRFCDEYLIDLNATQAAIRAGYSKKTARSTANENMTKPDIQAYLSKKMQKRAERTEITQDRVLQEIALIAFSKASDYAEVVEKDLNVEVNGHVTTIEDADGNPVKYRTVEPKLTADLTEDQKKALAVIKKGRDGFEIKPYDKLKALEMLGRHLGMFNDEAEVDTDLNLNIKVDYGDGS